MPTRPLEVAVVASSQPQGPEEGPAVLGFAVRSFPVDFLETLRWDINVVLVYLGKRASLASLLGWDGGGGGEQCHWAFHPCSGFGNYCVQTPRVL